MVPFDFLDQGGPIEMKKFGCLVFYPLGSFKGLEYEGFFKLGYRGIQTDPIL
jgi:hypothetical protein